MLLAFNNGPNAFVGSGKSTVISQPPVDDWYSITVIHGRLKFENQHAGGRNGRICQHARSAYRAL